MSDKENTITLHQGGTGEREIAISSIIVPDLWHIAQYLISVSRGLDLEIGNTKEYSHMILECWHLAHAMKDHLQQLDPPTDTIRTDALADIIRKAHNDHQDHAPLIAVQSDICQLIDDDAKGREFMTRCRTAPKQTPE